MSARCRAQMATRGSKRGNLLNAFLLIFIPAIAMLMFAGFGDFPEISVVATLGVYFVLSGRKELVRLLVEKASESQLRLCAAMCSRTVVVCLSTLICALLIVGMVQVAIVLTSILGYFVVYEITSIEPPESTSGKICSATSTEVKKKGLRERDPDFQRTRKPKYERDPVVPVVTQFESFAFDMAYKHPEPCKATINFMNEGFEALMHRHCSTAADEEVAGQIAKFVQKMIAPILPESDAKVAGIPVGNLKVIGAGGEKPEVDVVVTVNLDVLRASLSTYFASERFELSPGRSPKDPDSLLPEFILKTACRALSEQIEGCRFWRSEFSSDQPKIVLLIPVDLGFLCYPVRMNLAVNAQYPLRLAKFLKTVDSQCKELSVLVQRWAEDRGIARNTKGHMHPYAWALLVAHFMCNQEDAQHKTTLELLADFMAFYAKLFHNRENPVIISTNGKDVQRTAESVLWGIPYIEDPFDALGDVGANMSAEGVARLKEEVRRAGEIFARQGEASLAELLEKWIPPHRRHLPNGQVPKQNPQQATTANI